MSHRDSSSSPMELSWAEQLEEQIDELEKSGKQQPDYTGKENPVNETTQTRKVSVQEPIPYRKRAKSEVRPKTSKNQHSPTRNRSTSDYDRRSRNKSGDQKQRDRYREKSRGGNKAQDHGDRRRYSSRDANSIGKPKRRIQSAKSSRDTDQKQVSNANYNELDLNSIKNDLEDHIIISDMDLNLVENDMLPLLVHCKPNNSMQELVYCVNQAIDNSQPMKDTYITVMIFQRFFPILGCVRLIKIAEKLTNNILNQREQLLLPAEQRNPAIKLNRAIFKCHVTFATLTFTPNWEHLWEDIQLVNFKLKQCNDKLKSNHFNCHMWLTKPAGSGNVQVRGSNYEEFSRKQGLGENLNDAGIKLIVKGLIRHHTYGVTGNKSPAKSDPTPIPLETTSGYMMTERNQDNRWIDPFMAIMAARLYEQSQQLNHVVVIDQEVDEVFAEINPTNTIDAKTQTTTNDSELEIQNLRAKIISQENKIKNKDEELKLRAKEVDDLENKNYSLSRQIRNNQDVVCRKIEKHEELAKAYQAKISKVDKTQSKSEEKLSFYKDQYERDQSKISELKLSVNKLTEDLRQEKDDEIERLEGEVKYLRMRLEEQKPQQQPDEIGLQRQIEDLQSELACEQEETESLQTQVISLQKQVETLRKKNKESNN